MHKLPQPVKLWYLSSFFRYESRRPAATASSGRSAPRRSAPTTRRSTPRSILLLRELLGELGVRGAAPAARRASARRPRAPPTASELQAHLRAHEDELADGRARAHRPQPAARLRLRPRRHARGDGERAAAARPASTPRTREHFAAVRALLDAAGVPVRGRPHARARPGLLHAHGLRVHLRRARRAERRRRRRALRRPGRAARRRRRRPASAGRPASSGSCSPPSERPLPEPVVDLYVALDDAGTARATRSRIAVEARRAGLPAQLELGGRSLKGQLKQADRDRRSLRCDRGRRTASS